MTIGSMIYDIKIMDKNGNTPPALWILSRYLPVFASSFFLQYFAAIEGEWIWLYNAVGTFAIYNFAFIPHYILNFWLSNQR